MVGTRVKSSRTTPSSSLELGSASRGLVENQVGRVEPSSGNLCRPSKGRSAAGEAGSGFGACVHEDEKRGPSFERYGRSPRSALRDSPGEARSDARSRAQEGRREGPRYNGALVRAIYLQRLALCGGPFSPRGKRGGRQDVQGGSRVDRQSGRAAREHTGGVRLRRERKRSGGPLAPSGCGPRTAQALRKIRPARCGRISGFHVPAL